MSLSLAAIETQLRLGASVYTTLLRGSRQYHLAGENGQPGALVLDEQDVSVRRHWFARWWDGVETTLPGSNFWGECTNLGGPWRKDGMQYDAAVLLRYIIARQQQEGSR